MIEFTTRADRPVAINPRLVAAVFEKDGASIVSFGESEDGDVHLADPYEVVLDEIRKANAEDHGGAS